MLYEVWSSLQPDHETNKSLRRMQVSPPARNAVRLRIILAFHMAVIYYTQDFRVYEGHVTSRCQGLFPPHPFFEGKALGTRLTLSLTLCVTLTLVLATARRIGTTFILRYSIRILLIQNRE